MRIAITTCLTKKLKCVFMQSQKLPEEVKDELPDTIRRNEKLFKKLEESSKSNEPFWKTQR